MYGGEEGGVHGGHLGGEEGVHAEQQALQDLALQLLEVESKVVLDMFVF